MGRKKRPRRVRNCRCTAAAGGTPLRCLRCGRPVVNHGAKVINRQRWRYALRELS